MKLSEELRLRGAEVGDTIKSSVGLVSIPDHACLENLGRGNFDNYCFLWLVDKDGNKKERIKLSEELRLRGAEVGDVYCIDKCVGTGTALRTSQIYNSDYLERLLSGRYDEGGLFLWLADENGIKKLVK